MPVYFLKLFSRDPLEKLRYLLPVLRVAIIIFLQPIFRDVIAFVFFLHQLGVPLLDLLLAAAGDLRGDVGPALAEHVDQALDFLVLFEGPFLAAAIFILLVEQLIVALLALLGGLLAAQLGADAHPVAVKLHRLLVQDLVLALAPVG